MASALLYQTTTIAELQGLKDPAGNAITNATVVARLVPRDTLEADAAPLALLHVSAEPGTYRALLDTDTLPRGRATLVITAVAGTLRRRWEHPVVLTRAGVL